MLTQLVPHPKVITCVCSVLRESFRQNAVRESPLSYTGFISHQIYDILAMLGILLIGSLPPTGGNQQMACAGWKVGQLGTGGCQCQRTDHATGRNNKSCSRTDCAKARVPMLLW